MEGATVLLSERLIRKLVLSGVASGQVHAFQQRQTLAVLVY